MKDQRQALQENQPTQQQDTSRRSRRCDAGTTRLQPRDEVCLNWIGEQMAVRMDQLPMLLGRATDPDTDLVQQGQARKLSLVSESAARKVVARWRRARLVEYEKVRMPVPGWVWLSRTGLEYLGLPYTYCRPAISQLEHRYAINQVRLFVELFQPWGATGWTSERHLRYEGRGGPGFLERSSWSRCRGPGRWETASHRGRTHAEKSAAAVFYSAPGGDELCSGLVLLFVGELQGGSGSAAHVVSRSRNGCGCIAWRRSPSASGSVLSGEPGEPGQWSVLDTRERGDVRNGLAACPTHDAAFIEGCIIVNGGLRIHQAGILKQSVASDPGVAGYFGERLAVTLLLPHQAKEPKGDYLPYHRDPIFRG